MKIKYSITKNNATNGNYSVFLSHSNSENRWQELISSLSTNGINVNSDKEIRPGAPDFAESIKDMIRNNEIMIMLIVDSVITPWMIYELGLASGLGKKIILFSYDKIEERGNHYLEQYGPVINDVDFLVREIKNSFFFAELFEYETANLTKSSFLKSCIQNIDLCNISFNLPGIEEVPKHAYKFGYILLAISRYEKLVNKNRLCTICNMTADEIVNENCEFDGKTCSLLCKQTFSSPTDVILNKILYNSNVDIITQSLKITLPFNRQNGVTFKCFVDIFNMDYVQDVTSVLEKAGLQDISVSHSSFGNRIYFMLPQSSLNGLFAVEAPDGFLNNYLCKGAVL
ncbi:MAG: toll/interleukin-1 receptor domain-containing protein [Clostridia bacterium]|nr:toll/interleukin-1 receptor domain-containing protein [Clostridia bacterium]